MDKGKIAVFCSSSNTIDQKYHQPAIELAQLLVSNQFELIHGGGIVGLMGTLSKTVHQAGGKSIGIIPERLNIKGIVSTLDDETIVTADMSERKKVIRQHADAFIALPGGYGTIEEITEVITLKQLKYHNKPVVLLNSFGFYDHFIKFIDHFFAEKFTKEVFRSLLYITDKPQACINYIKNYKGGEVPEKWTLELDS